MLQRRQAHGRGKFLHITALVISCPKGSFMGISFYAAERELFCFSKDLARDRVKKLKSRKKQKSMFSI